MAFNSAGNLLASYSDEGLLIIWNYQNNELVKFDSIDVQQNQWNTNQEEIFSLCFKKSVEGSPHEILFAGLQKGKIVVFQINTDKLINLNASTFEK